MHRLSVQDRLGLDAFILDKEPHIVVDTEICRTCVEKPCIHLCPAGLFRPSEDGGVSFSHEGCLECGMCRLACPHGAVRWSYPRGGKGVQYHYG